MYAFVFRPERANAHADDGMGHSVGSGGIMRLDPACFPRGPHGSADEYIAYLRAAYGPDCLEALPEPEAQPVPYAAHFRATGAAGFTRDVELAAEAVPGLSVNLTDDGRVVIVADAEPFETVPPDDASLGFTIGSEHLNTADLRDRLMALDRDPLIDLARAFGAKSSVRTKPAAADHILGALASQPERLSDVLAALPAEG